MRVVRSEWKRGRDNKENVMFGKKKTDEEIKEELRKLKKDDPTAFLFALDGEHSKLAWEVMNEGWNPDNTPAGIMERKRNFIVDSANEENVFNLSYKGYSFPISKRLYREYCTHFGFPTEKQIRVILESLYGKGVKKELVLDDIDPRKVAGMVNLTLSKYMCLLNKTDHSLLEENEYGYSFDEIENSNAQDAACKLRDFEDFESDEEFFKVLSKWRDIFSNSKREFGGCYIIIMDSMVVNHGDYIFHLKASDFWADDEQFRESKEQVIADLKAIGADVSYFENERLI